VTVLRGPGLRAWLSSLPAEAADAAVEARLGIDGPRPASSPPGEGLIGYHPSGVSEILRAIDGVPVVPEDVVVDLGSGLGKVALLAHLLSGARARGVEIQADLVRRARASAARLDLDVRFTAEDARAADLADGTVFFLYAPFDGAALLDVVRRLHRVASAHAISVCALGIDLPRTEIWLVPRPTEAFWLTIYDSVVPGVAARGARD
jgi:SAM-dependent methyltransferase